MKIPGEKELKNLYLLSYN